MAEKTITLKLQGVVTLDAFSAALTHFSRLVSALSEEAKAKGMSWDVTALESSSAIITACADLEDGFTEDQADFVVSTYANVGRELAEHSTLSGYKSRVRKPALALAEITNWGLDEVVFETAEEDVFIRAPESSVQEVRYAEPIPFPSSAHGSVTGRVQSLSNRGGLRFTIYEVMSDRAVSCYLAAGSENLMIDMWGKLATVEGEVSRDPVAGRPIAVRHIEIVTIENECEMNAYKQKTSKATRPPRIRLPPSSMALTRKGR